MFPVVEYSSYAGYLFLLLTARRAILSAWRQRDYQHLNVLYIVISLVWVSIFKGQPGSVLWTVHVILYLVQPYLAIRLIQLFREVPAVVERGAIGASIAGAIAVLGWPGSRPEVIEVGILLWVAALQLYVSQAFFREAKRSQGVTSHRLLFAAAGSLTFAVIFFDLSLAGMFPSALRVNSSSDKVLSALVCFCYYIAFATPHRLKDRWQSLVTAKYLRKTAKRDTEDRGAEAANDLLEAVAASVSNAVTLVACQADPTSGDPDLVVWSSIDQSLLGQHIIPAAGLIGHAYRSGAIASTPMDCEPAVAEMLRSRGSRVLVAPITSEKTVWGVVIVVQRLGSLFPDDDLKLIAELAGYAGVALHHAELLAKSKNKVQAEAEREKREAEERMALLLGSIKDYALYVLDEHGAINTWHPGAELVFGAIGGEVRKTPAARLFGISEAEFQEHLAQALREGHVEFECDCLRRDGSHFRGITVLRPIDSRTTDFKGFACVTHDVTVRRDLEARLLRGQKLEAVGQLAGGIAHDFNNLLQVIAGNVDLVRAVWPGQFPEEFDDISSAADRAATLTHQLLAFSQRQMLHPVTIEINQVIETCLPILRRTLGAQVIIETDLAPDLAPVTGAMGQVDSMLLSLAVNASDAMPGGGKLTICTANERVAVSDAELRAGSYVALIVADTGVGMDEATLSHVFEPFFTTKGLGRGTGLGLATLYGAVHQMGGAIRVTSEPEKGTTFRLLFPAAQRKPSEPSPSAGSTDTAAATTQAAILVVEDNDSVRALLKRMLETAGYTVKAASLPSEALEMAKVKTTPIDLVITDVVMPGQLGPAFVASLSEVRPGLPVLYISGYSDAIAAWHGGLPKEGHFLQKPFTSRDLLSRGRDILSA